LENLLRKKAALKDKRDEFFWEPQIIRLQLRR
jgi:hypothetical protein